MISEIEPAAIKLNRFASRNVINAWIDVDGNYAREKNVVKGQDCIF